MSAEQPNPSVSRSELADELEAVVRARQELTRDEERFLIETFLKRLDDEIDARIQAKIGSRPVRKAPSSMVVLPIALVFAIPLSAIAGDIAQLPGLIVAWVAIAAVVLFVTQSPSNR